ncbi:2,3-butanediol dehydrogenase, R-alcohol forming, - and -acetoin-specific [Rhodococcus sp. B7740]|uniref:alcohol dehydrogenase catalytic domain-containing protein n=1 Tax=Rhodococcus sp. B7740 TaxID=1564114 RepID=UPI0005D9DAB4|nr:alcohol dehydrogenase catalytic domain-containing protein [Rhodococcus sp. B7740]AJW38118.1 2,3-butanediol dehydrogenase, R-alcohol forming, - and -acetoin-specific [Rhodococcus sp. B7740]
MTTQSTHRAIVRQGSHSTVEERRTPTPGPGELLIAPESVSLCGTDIQIVRGDRDDPSPIVGHEGAARVMEVGTGVSGFAVGDRVVVNPTHPHDSSFLLGHNVEGLFQQRVVIGASAVGGGLVSLLPTDLSSARATLVEPYAVVRYALSCLARETPETLLIFGDGLIGNLAATLARSVLFPTVDVAMVHRTELGTKWTANHLPYVKNFAVDDEWERHLTGSVAVLVATHRAGTVASIDAALRRLGDRVVAVHPIGGVPAKATSDLLPGVDIAGVRQANTGGPTPPAVTTFTRGSQRVALTGNRGVTNGQLTAAATALTFAEDSIDGLLTHRRGIDEGTALMNTICEQRTRIVDDELVIRLVVDLNSHD